jgi:hypothetical protein
MGHVVCQASSAGPRSRPALRYPLCPRQRAKGLGPGRVCRAVCPPKSVPCAPAAARKRGVPLLLMSSGWRQIDARLKPSTTNNTGHVGASGVSLRLAGSEQPLPFMTGNDLGGGGLGLRRLCSHPQTLVHPRSRLTLGSFVLCCASGAFFHVPPASLKVKRVRATARASRAGFSPPSCHAPVLKASQTPNDKRGTAFRCGSGRGLASALNLSKNEGPTSGAR